MSVTSLASRLARATLEEQQLIATAVRLELGLDRVYVFDLSGYFTGAESKITSKGYRYLTKNNKFAVLGKAAQRVLSNANEYNQFSVTVLESDSIGVYLT